MHARRRALCPLAQIALIWWALGPRPAVPLPLRFESAAETTGVKRRSGGPHSSEGACPIARTGQQETDTKFQPF